MPAVDGPVEIWRSIILGPQKSWVLFKNGTCVILMELKILREPSKDLAAQAIALMQEWGQVHVGSPAGDFAVIELTGAPGWAVTCHHNDILTYVGPDEVDAATVNDVTVGLIGRSKRHRDACELEVLHVEYKPPGESG